MSEAKFERCVKALGRSLNEAMELFSSVLPPRKMSVMNK